jgi:hypothetical protein
MYNRDKIMQTLRDIKEEAASVEPYVVVAQPRRNKQEQAAQTFNGYGLCHVAMMGYSHGFVDVDQLLVDVARNHLIDRVLDSGAKYMFFIGEDTVVPYDAFEILHDTAEKNPGSVVCGVYYIKCAHAMISVKKDNHIIVPDVAPGKIFEAWQTGMDCMLIPVEILRGMRDQDPDLPFCCIANGIEDIPFVGEDNFFVHRLRRAGAKLLVNTNVQCLHMDLATGKYTAHASVNLKKYYTNIPVTEPLTLDDKSFIDFRWQSRLPGQVNNSAGAAQTWLPGQDIPRLLGDIENPLGVEIGTAEGYTTEYLLKTMPGLRLTGIDPYRKYQDWNGQESDPEQDHAQLMAQVQPYLDRFNLVRLTSDEAVGMCQDESLDFVFIDGLHTYQQVLKDCENYYPKLKKGGLLVGHDFARIPDVNQAARDFSQKVGKDILNAQQDLWYWYK